MTVEKGAHVPFHPTLADVSDQTKRAFSAVAANAIASKLEAKAKPMEFQAKLEAAAQLALEAEAHEARKKLSKKKKDARQGEKEEEEAKAERQQRRRRLVILLRGGEEEEAEEGEQGQEKEEEEVQAFIGLGLVVLRQRLLMKSL